MISEDLIQQFVKETELFEERTQAFESGEIDRKTFKGISGRFGCYAQREKNYMLRLRFPGGRISKEHLAFLGEKTREYPLELMKITTCQTIQVHNLSASQVVSLMREALEQGIITIGGGGDNPRNVMASPLSGTDREETFDVLPYAEAISDYLLGRMTELHLPRNLKVAYCGETWKARECKPLCQRYAPAFYQVRRLQSPGKVQKPLSSGHSGGRKDQRRVCPMSGGSQKRRNSLAGFLRSSGIKKWGGGNRRPQDLSSETTGTLWGFLSSYGRLPYTEKYYGAL